MLEARAAQATNAADAAAAALIAEEEEAAPSSKPKKRKNKRRGGRGEGEVVAESTDVVGDCEALCRKADGTFKDRAAVVEVGEDGEGGNGSDEADGCAALSRAMARVGVKPQQRRMVDQWRPNVAMEEEVRQAGEEREEERREEGSAAGPSAEAHELEHEAAAAAHLPRSAPPQPIVSTLDLPTALEPLLGPALAASCLSLPRIDTTSAAASTAHHRATMSSTAADNAEWRGRFECAPSAIGEQGSAKSSISERRNSGGQQSPRELQCVICLDAQKSRACIPCGHICVCERCAAPLTTCPICRETCTDLLRIYLS